MAKRDEQHVFGELSRVEEAGTENATSTSIDNTTSTSPNGTTSTSTYITTLTLIDVPTSSSIDDVDREVTMEDSSELEEWLKDIDQNSEKKLDDDQHTSRGYLETSKASIDQHQTDEIDRQPPHIIDRHCQPLIDRHHPPNIDRCPLLDRPPIWKEEAVELHKRVKRIHDPVKIVVPCDVVEVEFPIPPDRSVHLDS
ncbi:hypothetical protein F2Q69_00058749 [Brassica cretica]|uniref:Uncharacterized protein n=1 Tax=Brassica cretica TaxID=69181 RepID=A0A8S9RDX5_BRACR|nr:hypothetical protein F2Q69_00058749 [Brassica cretica]